MDPGDRVEEIMLDEIEQLVSAGVTVDREPLNRRVRRRVLDEMGADEGLAAWSKYCNLVAMGNRRVKNRKRDRAPAYGSWRHPSAWSGRSDGPSEPLRLDATGAVVMPGDDGGVPVMTVSRSSARQAIADGEAGVPLTRHEFVRWQRERQYEAHIAGGVAEAD